MRSLGRYTAVFVIVVVMGFVLGNSAQICESWVEVVAYDPLTGDLSYL